MRAAKAFLTARDAAFRAAQGIGGAPAPGVLSWGVYPVRLGTSGRPRVPQGRLTVWPELRLSLQAGNDTTLILDGLRTDLRLRDRDGRAPADGLPPVPLERRH